MNMEEMSIFDGVMFGHLFKTRDGHKAVYVTNEDDKFVFVVDGFCDVIPYVLVDGVCKVASFHFGDGMDIVSEWGGIDEDYLDRLAKGYVKTAPMGDVDNYRFELDVDDVVEGFKNGYRQSYVDRML